MSTFNTYYPDVDAVKEKIEELIFDHERQVATSRLVRDQRRHKATADGLRTALRLLERINPEALGQRLTEFPQSKQRRKNEESSQATFPD